MKRILKTNERSILFGVVGELGGVHFHVSHTNKSVCGIEIHILDGPCEHDGSTLVAREFWLPRFEMCNQGGDFEPLYAALERECAERFQA